MSEAEAAAALKMQADDGGVGPAMPLCDNAHAQQVWLAAIALYQLSFVSYYDEDIVRRRPYVASGHTDFVARSKGLRAPPAC